MNTATETARSRPSATVMNPPDFLIGCRPAVSNATPAFAVRSGCSRDPCRFGPFPSGSLLARAVIGGQNETVSDQASSREAADNDATSVVEAAGRFRIYLGAVAGVGKTYAMLNEGHRRLGRGADVVVGFVECHGRQLTEKLIDG